MIPRIIITPGEPAGIGPDIVIHAAQMNIAAELIVVADPKLLETRAKLLRLPLKLTPFHAKEPAKCQSGELKIIPVELKGTSTPGVRNDQHAEYVIACLELATEHCLEKITHALVTGPVHKASINAAGFEFTGHTEFLKKFCNVDDVLMLFVVDTLKVALATTHLPLTEVSSAITYEHLLKAIRLLHFSLQKSFDIKNPKIFVCGLNPHAGEEGTLGREEIDVIRPALITLREEGIHCIGPLPADTLFTKKYLAEADAIFAMYHDQGLPIVKFIGFDRAVNVTLGLPIIRTSVDHGTALDLSGTGLADPGSLKAAIELACKLSQSML